MKNYLEKDKFYILVPVYNTEKFIERCINSIINQSYKNFELILVDDGTPDNAGKISDEYALKDSRIRVIHKANGGIISARQAAVHKVFELEQNPKNCYAFFVDSDDYLLDGALSIIADNIQKYHSDLYIYSYDYSEINGKINSRIEKNIYNLNDKTKFYQTVLLKPFYNNLWRKVISLELLEGFDYTDYFHIQIGEDLVISLDLYKRAQTVSFLSDRIYFYNYNNQSVFRNDTVDKFASYFDYKEVVYNFIKQENVFDEHDFKKYLRKEMGEMRSAIQVIIKSELSFDIKQQLIKNVASNPFCSKIINQEGKHYLFTLIFNPHYFYLGYAMLFIRNKLGDFYHLFFR